MARPTNPHDDYVAAELYREGKTMPKIAVELGITVMRVWRAVVKAGLRRRLPGSAGNGKCVDCGKPCGKKKRCPLHLKVRLAESSRLHERRKRNTPLRRQRVMDEADIGVNRGHFGSSVGRWRGKKSGYAGPIVMQLELGE